MLNVINMKKSVIAVAFLVSMFTIQCKTDDGKKEERSSEEIVLKNTTKDSLFDKTVEIVRSKLNIADSSKFPVLTFNEKQIPLQLSDTNSDGAWDEIFLVVDFAPEEEKTFKLDWVNEQPEYPIRTGVRFGKRETEEDPVKHATEATLTKSEMPAKQGFQKYQTDGPSWENDKVGFRQYLDGRYSKDVFGKKISKISPEDVGINKDSAVEDTYHVMEDWGRDILAVGNSVGMGGFALMVNDTVQRLGALVTDTISKVERTEFIIQGEGPVRSVLAYDYKDLSAGGNSYDVKETTSIWPGIYGFKNTVAISGLQGNEKLLVGLVNINNQNSLMEIEVNEDWVALITHDHQTYDREWILGLALILPREYYEGYIDAPKTGQLTDSFLAKLNVQEEKPVSYYVIAGWELSEEPRFSNAEFFRNYVVSAAKQLSAEVEITVK